MAGETRIENGLKLDWAMTTGAASATVLAKNATTGVTEQVTQLSIANQFTAGTNQQILFNNFGVLSGFGAWDAASGALRIPGYISLAAGVSGNAYILAGSTDPNAAITLIPSGTGALVGLTDSFKLGNTASTVTVDTIQSAFPNAALSLSSKGTGDITLTSPSGNVVLAAASGAQVSLGTATVGGTLRSLAAVGTASNIDISLVPKGTGQTYSASDLNIGIASLAGAIRQLKTTGSASDVSLGLVPKGNGSLSFFDPAGSFGSGTRVVFIANAAVNPSTNPTGGGILYSTGGIPHWKASSGTDYDLTSGTFVNPLTTTGDTIYSSGGTTPARLGIGAPGQVLTVVSGLPAWTTVGGTGTVTTVSVVTANGVSGSVATPTTTPAITLTLGAITPTTVNKITLTAPATGATLTIVEGKTLTANNSLTLGGTDSTTMTFPTTSASVARIDAAQTFTGTQTFSSAPVLTTTSTTGQIWTATNNFGAGGWATGGGGGGITNTAANNELMKSNGTNAVPSGIFSASAGVVTTGTWQGAVIAGQYGGTGVANTGKTITLDGNLTTSGAFNTVLAVSGSNTITFPNAGITVARIDAAQTFTGVQTFSSIPVFSAGIGSATATTQAPSDNSTKVATTAYVDGITLGPFSTAVPGYTNLSGGAGRLLLGNNSWLAAAASGNALLSGTTPSWGKIDLTAHVTGILPLANGGTASNLTDPAANKIMAWDDTDNTVGFWTLGTGLTYTHATHTLSSTGTGIANTAAANEMMKSDGTNAVPSGVFSTVAGDLTFGTGLTGSARILAATGTATDVDFIIDSKGASAFKVRASNHSFYNQSGASPTSFWILQADNGSGFTFGPGYISGATVRSTLYASAQGLSGAINGGDVILRSGLGYSVGNSNSGNAYVDIGTPNGSGKYGNLGLLTAAGSFGNGEKVTFIPNAITKPTSNPTGGAIVYPDGSNASDPTVRLPSGEIIDLAIHVGTTAPSAPITGQLWVDTN